MRNRLLHGQLGAATPAGHAQRFRHRGPYGWGTHVESGVGLGMTHLAIIDLAGGRQPVANEDDSIWIAFSGEICNHRLLRRDLDAKGHWFATQSDTEAILHRYEDAGEGFVSRDQRGSPSSILVCIDATPIRLHQSHAFPLARAVESEAPVQCETGN